LVTFLKSLGRRKDETLSFALGMRTFFTTPIRVYTEKRLIGYTKPQMHKLVSNTTNYPEFVPFCLSAKTLSKTKTPTQTIKQVELTIGFLHLQEKYLSNVTIQDSKITALSHSDIFKKLNTNWGFEDRGNESVISFSLEFQFNSILHQQAATLFMEQGVQQMVHAFEQRALDVYGKPSMVSTKI
jgi:coenzyme Q-binding protein COQ10